MKNEAQIGLLLLQRFLYEQTDEQHTGSVSDILRFWQQHGIQAGRKSVYTDIKLLRSAGMDIICLEKQAKPLLCGGASF